ncbi:MAG: M56 family metallopeptidase [Halioglobus sp.]
MTGNLTLLMLEILSPEELVGLLVKGTLICLLGLSVGSSLSFMPAAVRHRIALGTVFCLLLLPLLSWSLSSWNLPILSQETMLDATNLNSAFPLLVTIYLGIALLLFARLCIDLVKMALLSGRAVHEASARQLLPSLDHPLGDILVKYSSEIRTPLTWGWMKPRVLLPENARAWDAEDLSMVFHHELTHIERADWLGHIVARSVQAMYWPIPGIGQLLRQLSLSMEQACDDRVLATGISAPSYAAMLLRQAVGSRVPATVSLGHSSELGTRVRYLVVEIVDHSVLATSTAVTFLACIVLTVPLATMQLGKRPILPDSPWGRAKPVTDNLGPTLPPKTTQFDSSVLAALHPRPEHPARPPFVERPPQFKGQDKPSIPPP